MAAEQLTTTQGLRIIAGESPEWTGIALPDSGNYVIPLALAPLTVNRETDQATYLEPNVWVELRVG